MQIKNKRSETLLVKQPRFAPICLTRDIYRLCGNVAKITCLLLLTFKYIDNKMKNTSLKKSTLLLTASLHSAFVLQMYSFSLNILHSMETFNVTLTLEQLIQ